MTLQVGIPGGLFIFLSMQRLDTELDRDVVEWYDGNSTAARQTGRMSGSVLSSTPVISSGMTVTIKWTSGQGILGGQACCVQGPNQLPRVSLSSLLALHRGTATTPPLIC